MGKNKFLFHLVLIVLSSIGNVVPQQNTFFNQNPFNRPQPFNRQPFQPLPPILPSQAAYQPYNPRNYVPITSYQNEVSHDGSFAYGYTAGDGTTAQAQGYLKNAGRKDLEAQVVQGSYSYTSPEGTPIRVTYIADENGFRAEGAHLPTPPPIPEAIAKSLQFIASVQPVQNSLNPYQTPQQQFQQQQRQNQLTPAQLQLQYSQQQSGQYQPQQYQQQPQRKFPQQSLQQQQQQQQQPQSQQQPLTTAQLQGRTNQIPNQFAFNKFRRYK